MRVLWLFYVLCCVIQRLCEHQLDRNEEIRTEVKRLGPAAFRMNCSVGLDMQGNSYWMLEVSAELALTKGWST